MSFNRYCSSPGVLYADHAGDLPASATQVLGLKTCTRAKQTRLFLYYFVLLIFTHMSYFACMYICVLCCLKRLEETVRKPGTGVIDGCELPVCAGN